MPPPDFSLPIRSSSPIRAAGSAPASPGNERASAPPPEYSLPFGRNDAPLQIESAGASRQLARGTAHMIVTGEALHGIVRDSLEADALRAAIHRFHTGADGFTVLDDRILSYQFPVMKDSRVSWFSAVATLLPGSGRIKTLCIEQQLGGYHGNEAALVRMELDIGPRPAQPAGHKRGLSHSQQQLLDLARKRQATGSLDTVPASDATDAVGSSEGATAPDLPWWDNPDWLTDALGATDDDWPQAPLAAQGDTPHAEPTRPPAQDTDEAGMRPGDLLTLPAPGDRQSIPIADLRRRIDSELGFPESRTALHAWLDEMLNAAQVPAITDVRLHPLKFMKKVEQVARISGVTPRTLLETSMDPDLNRLPAQLRNHPDLKTRTDYGAAIAARLGYQPGTVFHVAGVIRTLTGVDLKRAVIRHLPADAHDDPFPKTPEYRSASLRFASLTLENKAAIRTFFLKAESLPSSFGLTDAKKLDRAIQNALLFVEKLEAQPEKPGEHVERAAVPWLTGLMAGVLPESQRDLAEPAHLSPAQKTAIFNAFKMKLATLGIAKPSGFYPFVMGVTGVNLADRK